MNNAVARSPARGEEQRANPLPLLTPGQSGCDGTYQPTAPLASAWARGYSPQGGADYHDEE